MKTKKYRAATMREALESVKAELGEDALVLDSRKVRAGGLLGIGSKEVVEITVERPVGAAARNGSAVASRPSAHKNGRLLGLLDDSEARPARAVRADEDGVRHQPSLTSESEFGSSYAALAARAASGRRPQASAGDAQGPSRSIGVEIAPTAPKIIHRPAPPAVVVNSDADATPRPERQPEPTRATKRTDDSVSTQHESTLSNEIESLRAEVRELKFSLGALYPGALAALNRPAALPTEQDCDQAVYDSPYFEAYVALASTGIAPELARAAVGALIRRGEGHVRETRSSSELQFEALNQILQARVQFGGDPLAEAVATGEEPRAVVFIGPTGVGKTTTLAKLAAHAALRERRRVELITLDTYRIAAVEQLKTYAGIIGAGCHVARSVFELEALVRRFARDSVVLVDTTGRSPHDLADQLELADFLRANTNFVKCLTLPANSAAEDALSAVRKFALYGANALALTKLDETTRPGACVRVAAESNLPLQYLCAGQRVPEDFVAAAPDAFCDLVLRARRGWERAAA